MSGFLHNVEEGVLHDELSHFLELILQEQVMILFVIYCFLWFCLLNQL